MIAETNPSKCFHGGAAYKWIGLDFEHLDRADQVIDADVLDAWFDPSPRAIQLLKEKLAWSLRCSPPVVPAGVELAISRLNGISPSSILCGSGSSFLIFLALRELLQTHSRVLILDPMYGEYAHVLSNVIGCTYDSFELHSENNYRIDLEELVATVQSRKYDVVILVNPNNPSGQLAQADLLKSAIDAMPKETTIWIDEAYIDYAGSENSLVQFAAARENVIVCKSLSKVLALSGLRVAYLASGYRTIDRLRLITPPWSLSLPAQLVLIEALKDRQYYSDCYAQTHELRDDLSAKLTNLGFSVYSSTANFLLVDYPVSLPSIESFLSECSARLLLLRNVRSMGKMTATHSFRVAVKSAATNQRIVSILRDVTSAHLTRGMPS